MDVWLKSKLPTDKAFQSRMGQTLYLVRYTIAATGKRKLGRVAGWHEDPGAALQGLADAVGVAVHSIEVKPLAKERIVGARRRPDRIAIDLEAAREARREAEAEAEFRTYIALVHALLPPEEGITVEELHARHLAGEQIEDRLIGWLHSWHENRDTITREEVAAEWKTAKETKTVGELYEMFGIVRP